MTETEQAPAPWSAETQGASNHTSGLKLIPWKSDGWKVHGVVTVGQGGGGRGLGRGGAAPGGGGAWLSPDGQAGIKQV